MEDFIELGLEAMDTTIDKGFHMIPGNVLPSRKMFHRSKKGNGDSRPRSRDRDRRDSSPYSTSDEYEPRNRRYDDSRDPSGRAPAAGGARKSSGRSRRDDEPPYGANTSRGVGAGAGAGAGGSANYSDDRDRRGSRDDIDRPRSRDPRDASDYYNSPYYTPQSGMLAYGPPPTDRNSRPGSGYARDTDYPYNGPYDPRVRYPTPPYADNGNGYGESGKGSSRRSRSTTGQRRGGRPELKQRSSSVDRGENGLQKVFSNSDKGLGIGMLGAVAGGLLAQEAGLRREKSGGKGGKGGKMTDPIVLTLLGAALGGLGANALEKRFGERGGRRRDSYENDARDGERERERDRRSDRD